VSSTTDRGQSQVVGVAILLGLTVVSLGVLTAGIGTVIEENAASADATRVADGMATALDPVATTGQSRDTIAFTAGRVETVERQIRIVNGTRTVRTLDAGALVWHADDGRVAYVAGAVVRGGRESATLHAPPPVTASRGGGGGVLVVGAPRLDAGGSTVSGRGGATVPLRTNVSHRRTDLGVARFRLAVETRTPGALAPYFRDQNASVARRDIDGDGIPSVVATYPGQRRAYLVVHEMNLTLGGRAPEPVTPSPTDTGDEADERDDPPSDGERDRRDDDAEADDRDRIAPLPQPGALAGSPRVAVAGGEVT
jgi:hypothetical protein